MKKENELKLGDIVIVTVDHPDGATEETIGDVGIITRIEHHATYGDDYTVHTPYSDYAYGCDQIRELRDDECRVSLYNLLRRSMRVL